MDEKIKILFFGILAEQMQAVEIWIPGESDTDDMISTLRMRYPMLSENNFSIAVNKKIITENTRLLSGDEIALLPPFSGG